MKDRAKKAILCYLERIGYVIVDDDFNDYIVTYDEDNNTIAITSWGVEERDRFLNDKTPSQMYYKEFEKLVLAFFENNKDYIDVNVIYDSIKLVVMGDNKRGLISYYRNVGVTNYKE